MLGALASGLLGSVASSVAGPIGNAIGGFFGGGDIAKGFGTGIGNALSGFGSTYANAGFNALGQSQQLKQNANLGIDKQGGKNARDYMKALYGDDVSEWDWLGSSNSANSGAIQAPPNSTGQGALKNTRAHR